MASRKSSESSSPATLRLRARHRLIGALALVLAVSIVLPMLLTDEPGEPAPVPDILQVIPPIPANDAPQTAPLAVQPPAQQSPLPAPDPVPVIAPPTVATPAASPATTPAPPRSVPSTGNRPSDARSDDGSLALTLMQGHNPSAAETATAQTSAAPFALQVMALGNESDAQKQQVRLQEAGISNAYVQAASVNGKATWRLRVGPFPTRQAAQAAQTSLRTLGYTNSYIVQ